MAGCTALPAASLWRDLDEIPDRHVFQDAFHAAYRRLAAGAVTGNRQPFHQQLQDFQQRGYASNRVREGRSLSYSLEETKFFPDLAIEMIEVGESTGALPAMLNSVAEFYEEDVQNSLATAMQLVEPVILIFMGITVAVVLLSLYLPIFSLGAQAHT